MSNENPFAKAATAAEKDVATEKVEVPAETPKTGRQTIDETTQVDSNWINLPKLSEVGKATEILKIKEYFTQEGRMFNGPDGPFYSGLTTKDNNGAEIKHGEFVIEGTVDGKEASIRLSNWELVYKMKALVGYCRSGNLTLANQLISFSRVSGGKATAGKNWELLVGSLGIKISGKEPTIEKL